jgi:basic membrane protein A
MLTDFMNNEFTSGVVRFDAAINGVGLAMDTSRFTNFTQAQYEEIFNALQNNEIDVNSSLELEDIPVSLVTVSEL